jgi:hypothetical protein
MSEHVPFSEPGCLIFVKVGHLPMEPVGRISQHPFKFGVRQSEEGAVVSDEESMATQAHG